MAPAAHRALPAGDPDRRPAGGLPPARVSDCTSPPLLRWPIPIGDGSALLKRRPDVRQAERRLASSVATIGVTTAGLYPSVTLGGGLGTEAASLGDIVKNRAFQWNVGPMVTWTFPNTAIVRAEIAASNAQAPGQPRHVRRQRADCAPRDRERPMVTLARQLDTERDLTAARDDAATANRNVLRLYDGGVGEFLDTLDAERTLISADNAPGLGDRPGLAGPDIPVPGAGRRLGRPRRRWRRRRWTGSPSRRPAIAAPNAATPRNGGAQRR